MLDFSSPLKNDIHMQHLVLYNDDLDSFHPDFVD